jgi:hypothetical protein
MKLAWLVLAATVAATPFAAAQSLDFEFYKTKVEPIFLKKRGDHARCFVCHSNNNSAFKLEPLASGSTTYNDDQSRKNFESASRLVSPGNPDKSKLLLHPLSPDAGGDAGHSGGRQFESKDDPDWQTIAEWVRRAK